MTATATPLPRAARRAAIALAFAGVVETAALAAGVATPCAAGGRAACMALHATGENALLSVPLPLVGLVAYALAAALALLAPRTGALLRWLAAAMALFSLHLLLRLVALGSPCPWCLGSAALSLALFAVAMPWRQGVAGVLGAAAPGLFAGACLVFGAHAARNAAAIPPALTAAQQTFAQRLAVHLRNRGDVFYGTWWCPDCSRQKELFGTAAASLPYREADDEAAALGITEFPTWVVGGERLTGLRSCEELAQCSGLRAGER